MISKRYVTHYMQWYIYCGCSLTYRNKNIRFIQFSDIGMILPHKLINSLRNNYTVDLDVLSVLISCWYNPQSSIFLLFKYYNN